MSNPGDPKGKATELERIPYWQVFLDDIFLMLTLGLAVPSLLYLLWTMLDLTNVEAVGKERYEYINTS